MTSRRRPSPSSSSAAHVAVPYKDGSSSKRGNNSKQEHSVPPTLSSSGSSFVGRGAVSRDERRRHAAAMSAAGGKGVSLVERDDRHAAEAIAAAEAALDQDGIGPAAMNPNTDTHKLLLGSYGGQRAIFCIDQDCFYAQVVMRERPELRTRPLGITQKYLVVTCNYVARSLGVGKMCSITDALRQCPSLELVSGEDLTEFRNASDEIFHECQAFCREIMAGIARLDNNLTSGTKKHLTTTSTNKKVTQTEDLAPADDGDDDNEDDEEEEEEEEDASSSSSSSSAHEDMLQRLDDARFGIGGTLRGLPPFLASQARSMARRAGGSGRASSGGSVPAGGGVMLLERSGLDEIFFDCTALCHFVVDLRGFMTNAGIVRAFTPEAESESSTTTNAAQNSPSGPSTGLALIAQLLLPKPLEWKGHIVIGGSSVPNSSSSPNLKKVDASSPKSDQIFAVASAICDALRRRLKDRLQLDTCGGVGGNKMVAKLAVNLHKPNDQTTVLPRAVLSLLRPLPMRMLYGVGRKVAKLLKSINVHTVEDYLNASSSDTPGGSRGLFASKLGLDKATIVFLDQACHGVDTRPVKPDPGFRRSFSVEDSMVDCNSIAKSHAYLHHLSRDFWTRVVEDSTAHFRVPTHMMLKARFSGFRRVSRSRELPQQAVRIAKMLVQRTQAASKGLVDRGKMPHNNNNNNNNKNNNTEDNTRAAVASIEASAKCLLQECIHDFFAATGRKRGDTTKTIGPEGTLESTSGFNITLLGIGTQQFQQLARPGSVGVPAFFKSSRNANKSSSNSSTALQPSHDDDDDDESYRKRPRMDPVSEKLQDKHQHTWTCSRCTFINTQKVHSKQAAKLKPSRPVSRHPSKRICTMCGLETVVPDPNAKSRKAQPTSGPAAHRTQQRAEHTMSTLASKTLEGHRLHAGSSQSASPSDVSAPLYRSRFVDLRQFIPDAERGQYGLPQARQIVAEPSSKAS